VHAIHCLIAIGKSDDTTAPFEWGHVPAGHTGAIVAQGLADLPRARLKFLAEAPEAGTGAKASHWSYAGSRMGMVAGTATRLKKLFAVQTMPTGAER
jgi:hypothetical protein